MTPAFSSRRQAAAFALLLGVLLALPALSARTGWLDRRDVFPTIAWNYGPFPWIQQKIFAETADVDLAFIGSSHLWTAIDTPYVQRQLSEQIGREAEVFTFGWPWAGFDATYVIARDLLNHRRVHTLVIYDEEQGEDIPHQTSFHWFRIGENSEALDGLSWQMQASLYGGAVLGMPRHLLSFVRPNLLEDPANCRANQWNSYYRAPNLSERLGSLRAQLGYYRSQEKFLPFQARGHATPADVLVYSAETRDAFQFTSPAAKPYQFHFARKLAQLCQERGTRLVVLHTPNLRECGESLIIERRLWPEVLGAPVDIVGVPPAKLFAGIPTADVMKLFYDDNHLNQNGQEMFTRLIAPVLLTLYAAPTYRN